MLHNFWLKARHLGKTLESEVNTLNAWKWAHLTSLRPLVRRLELIQLRARSNFCYVYPQCVTLKSCSNTLCGVVLLVQSLFNPQLQVFPLPCDSELVFFACFCSPAVPLSIVLCHYLSLKAYQLGGGGQGQGEICLCLRHMPCPWSWDVVSFLLLLPYLQLVFLPFPSGDVYSRGSSTCKGPEVGGSLASKRCPKKVSVPAVEKSLSDGSEAQAEVEITLRPVKGEKIPKLPASCSFSQNETKAAGADKKEARDAAHELLPSSLLSQPWQGTLIWLVL